MKTNLRQDTVTGYLHWIVGPRAGKRAGSLSKDGYRRVYICGKTYPEHHVAWILAYGKWPDGTIDHINGNRSDNRLDNLRESDPLEQMRNRAIPRNNTSGVHGVTMHKLANRWQSSIQIKGKYIHLGLFDNLADAEKERKSAEDRFGFHANHGRKNT